MPNLEPQVIDGHAFTLRHVGPRSAVWPQALAANTTVLGCSSMVGRPLPSSNIPNDPDFATGSTTSRLDDAGEFTLTFPNADASDGLPWRSRFDPGVNGQRLQWVEVWIDEYLDHVGCLYTMVPDRQQVQLTGYDGTYCLKNAYERDWTVVQAPRDVFERGTQVWVPNTIDGFPAGTLNAQWTVSNPLGSGTATIGASGGLTLTTTSSGSYSAVQVQSPAESVPSTGTWRAMVGIATITVGSSSHVSSFGLTITESSGDAYELQLNLSGNSLNAELISNTVTVQTVNISSNTAYGLMLESDGEWIWAFVNGQLIGCCRRAHATTTSLQATLTQAYTSSGSTTSVTSGVLVEALQPFLMRRNASTDLGDYVLPGDSTTYPNGGLHARYYNDLDLAGTGYTTAQQLALIQNPTRSQAYGGSGTPEYMNQQDPQIAAQFPPGYTQTAQGPGSAALANWSSKSFGAVYLKLSQGNYTMQINTPAGGASIVRVWIGETRFGDQLVDQWSWQTGGNFSFTVNATTLAGTLSYGGGTVKRDGWYPIRVEYAVNTTALSAPTLYITNSPAAYTDPGGTAIASGSQTTVIPATSFSPLGMIDQRFQGIAHFDLCQTDVLQAFGYQASLEPKQLESGQFPGVFAPRIREGADTDAILEPDDSQRAEGINNYSNSLDATDNVGSVQGNGAGFQNGNTGQLQSMVYDAATLEESLFDVQGWQDFSDAAFLSLLQALLNSQLGLRLAPWQTISADPVGRQRLADAWPLTLPPALAQMRWRSGDGLRIQARDVNVQDTVPRQMLQFTRSFVPMGTTSAQATYASSPVSGSNYPLYSPSRARSPAKALKQMLFAATRLQRNYQKQLVTISGTVEVAGLTSGTTDTGSSMVMLTPGDQVVRARLRIGLNSAAQSLHVYVNSNDVTTQLNGPWVGVPFTVDLMPVLGLTSSSQFIAQLHNAGGSTTLVQYQLLVDVLR